MKIKHIDDLTWILLNKFYCQRAQFTVPGPPVLVIQQNNEFDLEIKGRGQRIIDGN